MSVLDITHESETIPILSKHYFIGIAGRWFMARPNGDHERKEILRELGYMGLEKVPDPWNYLLWLFARVCDVLLVDVKVWYRNTSIEYELKVKDNRNYCTTSTIFITLMHKHNI